MTRTVVVGGGVAGLVVARGLALAGDDVTVLESWRHAGGRVGRSRLGGVGVDVGAESYARRGGAVARLVDDLGLGADVVAPNPAGAWVALAGRVVPLPAAGVLGIPSRPWAADVRRVIGTAGALRACVDRVGPRLRPGGYRYVGPLVASRMGARVVDRLVAPVTEAVYGVPAADAPLAALLPGLDRAAADHRSLAGAIAGMRAAAPPGAAVAGIAGGLHRLVDALVEALTAAGGRLTTGTAVRALRPDGDGWQVLTDDAALAADRVVIATDGAAAWQLLDPLLPGLDALPRPARTTSRVVSVLLDDPALDAAPRGSGVLVAPQRHDVTVQALTHATAKWTWLAQALPGRHVVRATVHGDLDDAGLRHDLSVLLGHPVPEPLERVDSVWHDTAPPLDPATAALVGQVRAGLAARPTLAVVGSWTAGTGLASVVTGAGDLVGRWRAG